MSKEYLKRFETLDAFRGIFAISVVIFHLRIYDSFTESTFSRNSLFFVEFFFALSGFVLAHSYIPKKINLKKFIISRFFRLFPLHLIMLIVFIVLELGKLIAYKKMGMNFNTFPFEEQNAVSEILPNFFLLQSWIPGANHMSFNYPSWSISVEFYMYLIFFLTLLLRTICLPCWLFLFLASILMMATEKLFPNLEVIRGTLCFFGGVLTYYFYSKVKHFEIGFVFGTILEIFMFAIAFKSMQLDINYKYIFVPFAFFASILIFSFESGAISYFLKSYLFQVIGKLSYSIYMTHAATLFVLMFFFVILEKTTHIQLTEVVQGVRFMKIGGPFFANIWLIIALLIIVGVSIIAHKLIEIPGHKLKNKFLEKNNDSIVNLK